MNLRNGDGCLVGNLTAKFQLASCHDTSPGLAWKVCLKRTGIRLGLLTDPDMLLMFERGIRGGITQAVR